MSKVIVGGREILALWVPFCNKSESIADILLAAMDDRDFEDYSQKHPEDVSGKIRRPKQR